MLSPSSKGAPKRFRIDKLAGSMFRADSLYWVRLRATVCDPHPDRGDTYPSEIGVTHFFVSKRKSGRSWWPARAVRDRAPWLVPLGEGWGGKECGPVQVEDPITPEHYGVESLGNPLGCYGVSLTIVAGKRRASKRAIVSFGRRFGAPQP